MLLYWAGKRPEGLRLLKIASDLAPDSDEISKVLGMVYLSDGAFEESIPHFRQVLQLKPDSSDAHNHLGIALHSSGRLQEAARHYRDALAINPEHAEAHGNLGRALELSAETELAIEHYHEAIRLRPDWPTPYNNLAWILAVDPDRGSDERTEALTLAKRAVALTSPANVAILDTLGAALAAARRFEEAAKTAEHAIELAIRNDNRALADEIRVRLSHYLEKKRYLAKPQLQQH